LAREATACEESFSAGRAALSEDCVLGSFGSEASALITSGWRSDLLSGHREGYEELRTVRFSRRDGTELFEGFSASANLCASFNFIHFGSNPEFAKAICKAAAGHQVAKS
jgi:hypothetical protein